MDRKKKNRHSVITQISMRSLRIEVSDQCGITREFVFSHADGDPAGLFLLAMAWGSATVHWPSQRTMLTTELPSAKLAEIIRRTREHGPSAGWRAFRTDQRIYGLGPAFGTKLLCFAGYRRSPRPRPLVLDENALRAINSRETDLSTPIGPVRLLRDVHRARRVLGCRRIVGRDSGGHRVCALRARQEVTPTQRLRRFFWIEPPSSASTERVFHRAKPSFVVTVDAAPEIASWDRGRP